MSERNDAPRPGGRAAQPRTTTGRRGDAERRDAADRGTGVRGVRQFPGKPDTRRSGIQNGQVTGKSSQDSRRAGQTPVSREEDRDAPRAGKASARRGGDRDAPRAGKASARRGGDRDAPRAAKASGSRAGGLSVPRTGKAPVSRVGDPGAPLGRSRPQVDGPVAGTAALALEVTATAPQHSGRPKLWVAPPVPIRAPRVTFAAAVIAVVLVGVLGILLINTKTMEQSFRLDALHKEKVVLDKQQQGLEQQLIQASNPGNLLAAARRLGLVPAEAPAMIRLPDGKIIRPPTPAHGRLSPTAQDEQAKGRIAGEATPGNQPAGRQQAGNQPGGNQPGGDQAAGNQAGGNQPAGEQAAGNQPATGIGR